MTNAVPLTKYLALALALPAVAYLMFVVGMAILVNGHFVLFNKTHYSSDFSWWRFATVRPGISRESVVAMLGTPVDYNKHWGCTHPRETEANCIGLLWAVPMNGYGHFAQIDFVDEKVVGTRHWGDD